MVASRLICYAFRSFARRKNPIPHPEEGSLYAKPKRGGHNNAGDQIDQEADTALEAPLPKDEPVDMEG